MKKNYSKSVIFYGFTLLVFLISFNACNKKLDLPQPISFPQDSLTIGDYITNDTSYSLFKQMAIKVGSYANLTDKNQVYTVFAPNNNAMRSFQVPLTAAFIANAPASVVTSLFVPLVRYSIIPGEILTQDLIPSDFPNIQLPTALSPAQIPGTLLPFSLTAFPSKRGTNFWYNNAPGISQLAVYKNGVIYGISKVVVPPSVPLAAILYSDPRFTLFHAAINRGDAGQPANAQIDAALNNLGANLTLFAPTNTAMKNLIVGLSGGAIPFAAPDDVFLNFIGNFVPAQTARGLVVYHILGTRAFSVNFPSTPTYFPTLLNLGIPNHPGVQVQSFFTGQTVDSIKVFGVGNGRFPATSKPSGNFDLHAINGVMHIIDMVLLPQ